MMGFFKMNHQTAIKLAHAQNPDASLYETMKIANTIAEVNSGHGGGSLPFAPVDIVSAEFVDWLKNNGSQRELDLVTFRNLLYPVWRKLHISVQILGAEITKSMGRDIDQLLSALYRLNLEHLLLDGLNDELLERVKKMVKET